MRLGSPYSGDIRKADGATVTFVRDDGALITLACKGTPVFQAIRSLCEDVESAQPGRWTVQAISTPGMIWRDLRGVREQEPDDGGRFADDLGVRPVAMPEAQLLTRAGYGHLYRAPNMALQDHRGARVTAPQFHDRNVSP